MQLQNGSRVALVCCSDGLKADQRERIARLKSELRAMGLVSVESETLYRTRSVFSAPNAERAAELMRFYADPTIDAIFDVSGGDLANGVLPYLDYEAIACADKPFFGYSDLTTVLNAIYTKTGLKGFLYQVRNLIGKDAVRQMEAFRASLLRGAADLFHFDYRFLRGESMEGTMVGGNIRCLLKLAGTEYFPDCTGKILFLEAKSTGTAAAAAMLQQLRQMGVFEKAAGVLLGSFSQMDKENGSPNAGDLLLELCGNDSLPAAKTPQIGHGADSRCLIIGKHYEL